MLANIFRKTDLFLGVIMKRKDHHFILVSCLTLHTIVYKVMILVNIFNTNLMGNVNKSAKDIKNRCLRVGIDKNHTC